LPVVRVRFGLVKLWEALGRLADAIGKLAGTIERASGELDARCNLPAPAEAKAPALPAGPVRAPALPAPAANGNGHAADPAKLARNRRGRKAKVEE
jgi:hypothetical protein